MNKIFLGLICTTISTAAQAADFTVSRDCRATIKADLKAQGIILKKINYASYYPGGSDGASSFDSEYIVNANVTDAEGNSIQVLVNIDDSYNCRVNGVSKIYNVALTTSIN